MTIRIGMVGLGRMGANMAQRWLRGGLEVVGSDRDPRAVTRAGVEAAADLSALTAALAPPRLIWLMLPAGEATEAALASLGELLAPGDLIVDGANSWYRDTQRRAAQLASAGVALVDVGVSGGIWGRDQGYGLMVGGDSAAVARVEPLLKLLAPAPDRGWLHCGVSGAGHYVKMVHNGIEYGMMQAYAEGFALMKAKQELDLDLAAIAESWRHGSVVRSWLLDLTAAVLAEDQDLASIAPHVADSGAGRWSALEGVELGVPTPVMSLALMMRFASQGGADYGARLQAMMRQAFGGHALHATPGDPDDTSRGMDA